MPFFYQTTLIQTRAQPSFLSTMLLTFVLLSSSGSLWAQPSDETITVTASRLPMDSLRSGSQITIISKADIDLRNPNSLPDLLRGQPGLSVSQRSEERRVGKECRSRWSPYH